MRNLSMAFQALTTVSSFLAWFEYVPSASNPDGGGSRVGTCDSVADELGMKLEPVEFSSLLDNLFDLGPTNLIELWKERA